MAGLLDGLTAHQRYKRGIGQQADQFDKAMPSPVDLSRYDGQVVNRGELFPIGEYRQPDGSNKFGLAMPGILSGEMPQMGDRSPEAAQSYGRAAVSGVMFPGAGRAAAGVPSNALGMFGGRLAKTADQAALVKAEELAAKGAPREQIWNDTGWFQGPDKKWRFEIDDSKAFVKGGDRSASESAGRWGPQFVGDLGSGALYHPQLAEAYPEIKNVRFQGHPGRGGYYEKGMLDDGVVSVGNDYRGKEKNSVALHEAQHIVQGDEGFARGGSAKEFGQQKDAELARNAMTWRREMDRYPSDLGPSGRDNAVVEDYYKMGAPDWIPERRARDVALDRLGNPDEQLNEIIKLYGLDMKTTPYTDKELYKRLTGEVEARAVQSRMNLTPDQRRARFPWLDYDVPESQQIIRGILP